MRCNIGLPAETYESRDKISNTYIRIRHREHGSCCSPRRLPHSAIRNAPRKPRHPHYTPQYIHRSCCSLARRYRGKVKLLSTWNSDYRRNCAKLPSARKIIQGKLGKEKMEIILVFTFSRCLKLFGVLIKKRMTVYFLRIHKPVASKKT